MAVCVLRRAFRAASMGVRLQQVSERSSQISVSNQAEDREGVFNHDP